MNYLLYLTFIPFPIIISVHCPLETMTAVFLIVNVDIVELVVDQLEEKEEEEEQVQVEECYCVTPTPLSSPKLRVNL